jgi:holo-[acyl-carrier protein] synthase
MDGLLALGVDVIEIHRIAAAHGTFREKFLRRIFTAEEIAYCLQKKHPYPSLAANFAGKEAVSKALGQGFGERLTFPSIAIHREGNGAPCVVLDEMARLLLEKMGGTSVLVSLSHSRLTAIAHCAIIGKKRKGFPWKIQSKNS